MKRIAVLIDGTCNKGVGRNTNVGLLDPDFKIDGSPLIYLYKAYAIRMAFHKLSNITKALERRRVATRSPLPALAQRHQLRIGDRARRLEHCIQ
jgi:hypothetical protein